MRERERLGKRLRELRTARKMTQAEAAEAAGVHTVHVARIESGAANITISTLVAFAVAYNVPVHAFFEPQSFSSAVARGQAIAAEPLKPSRPKRRRPRRTP